MPEIIIMKRLLYPVLLICISVLTFNCQKEVSFSGDPVSPIPGSSPITASLQGTVFDETGNTASGVSIKVGNKTVITDAKGYFRINNASLDKRAALVIAEKTGYFKAFRTFNATSGTNRVMIKLIKKTTAGTINASSGGNVSLINGAKISLPANSVVNAQTNAAYSGSVTVYAAYIDPTSADIGKEVPGSFAGTDVNNKSVVLTSYGMMAVELVSASGEKLQIASGKSSTLTTPIPASAVGTAPATISLWYLDEQTGLWKEEGKATKNGSVYTGDVKHFSYWNCDYPGPRVNFTAKFKDQNGNPLTYTYVSVFPSTGGINGSAHGYTDSLGQVSGPIPANLPLILRLSGPYCYYTIYNQNIGPFAADVDLGEITVTNNIPQFATIQGRLVNCNGAPIANGYAMIYYDYTYRWCPTNANGLFETSFYACNSTPYTCTIYGMDQNTQQQSISASYNIIYPLTDVGNIVACGVSTLEYINYNLDGVDYNYSNAISGDSLHSFSSIISNPPYTLYTWMHGTRSPAFIYFDFLSANATAAYPLRTLQTTNYQRIAQESPININFTNHASLPGDYFEGGFSGQFRDTSNLVPLHTISCTFRMRRN